MGLAVKKFFEMRPQLSFRFSVDINVNSNFPNGIEDLGICVKNVKVTSGEVDTTTGAVYYGDGYFTIPTYNVADKTLEISFNETDDLTVLKWLDGIQEGQRNSTPTEIDIRVTEYDETMTNEISKILYTCCLKEYSEPAFARSGSVSFSTIDATFIVIDEVNELSKEKLMTSNITQNDLAQTNNKTTENVKMAKETYSLKDAKNEFKELKERMRNEGVDTTSYAEVASWLRNNNVYYNASNGICATGVSLISNIVEDNECWIGHGNGKDYNIRGGRRQESSSTDINKKIKDLKAGESFIVSFDIKTGENKSTENKSNREKYGHVVLVSKDKEGNLMYTSDFEQKSWQTYKDLSEWEKQNKVSLSIIDTSSTR